MDIDNHIYEGMSLMLSSYHIVCCFVTVVQEGGIKHTVYYPTPASLAARSKLAEQLGVSLSIWELRQSMDAFFDLL